MSLGNIKPVSQSRREAYQPCHRAECYVGRVDQDEGRPKRAAGAVQVELDGPLPAGVQRQERAAAPSSS